MTSPDISTLRNKYYAGDASLVEEKQLLLEKSGVIVTKSNYQSTRLASALMNALERR